jgi:hypothetical protein
MSLITLNLCVVVVVCILLPYFNSLFSSATFTFAAESLGHVCLFYASFRCWALLCCLCTPLLEAPVIAVPCLYVCPLTGCAEASVGQV